MLIAYSKQTNENKWSVWIQSENSQKRKIGIIIRPKCRVEFRPETKALRLIMDPRAQMSDRTCVCHRKLWAESCSIRIFRMRTNKSFSMMTHSNTLSDCVSRPCGSAPIRPSDIFTSAIWFSESHSLQKISQAHIIRLVVMLSSSSSSTKQVDAE